MHFCGLQGPLNILIFLYYFMSISRHIIYVYFLTFGSVSPLPYKSDNNCSTNIFYLPVKLNLVSPIKLITKLAIGQLVYFYM